MPLRTRAPLLGACRLDSAPLAGAGASPPISGGGRDGPVLVGLGGRRRRAADDSTAAARLHAPRRTGQPRRRRSRALAGGGSTGMAIGADPGERPEAAAARGARARHSSTRPARGERIGQTAGPRTASRSARTLPPAPGQAGSGPRLERAESRSAVADVAQRGQSRGDQNRGSASAAFSEARGVAAVHRLQLFRAGRRGPRGAAAHTVPGGSPSASRRRRRVSLGVAEQKDFSQFHGQRWAAASRRVSSVRLLCACSGVRTGRRVGDRARRALAPTASLRVRLRASWCDTRAARSHGRALKRSPD